MRGQHTQLRGSDVDRLVAVLELNLVTLDPVKTPRQPVSHRMLSVLMSIAAAAAAAISAAERRRGPDGCQLLQDERKTCTLTYLPSRP